MATNNSTNNIPAIPLTVSTGGGATSYTAFAPIAAGTTSTGPFQSISTGISTSGNTLTSNGAGRLPSFQRSNGSIVLIQQQIANNTFSTFTFTGLSGYQTYMIVITQLIVPVGGSTIFTNLYLSNNNGSSYITTGYTSSLIGTKYDGTASQNSPSSGVFHIGYTNAGGATKLWGTYYLNVGGTNNFPSLMGNYIQFNAGTGTPSAGFVRGIYNTAITTNAFEIVSNNGNFTSGTIELYGIKS